MALDAVILDVDGTLLDTNPIHVEGWRRALQKHGFQVPFDRIAMEVGKGGDLLVTALLGARAEKEHGDAIRETVKGNLLQIVREEPVRIFEGARELLQQLRDKGLKIAIATSASAREFQTVTKSAGLNLEELADVLTNKDDARQSKPAPDLVLAACERLEMSPAQCVMIGDSPYDAEACRHAGVVCLGVLEGSFHDESMLKEAGARLVYPSLKELLNDLDNALDLASPGAVHLTRERQEELMREALQVAREGMNNGEVPIGSVLADGNGNIIARGYNEMNATRQKTAHAEIITFQHAAGKVPLEARDLILVSTLEPCVMCTGAAMEAAVDTIIYGLRAPADSGTGRVRAPQSPESQMPRIVGDVLPQESRALFEEWLQKNQDIDQARFIKQLLKLT